MASDLIETTAALEAVMTRPSPALVSFVRTLASPLVVLGAGGKMGPSLCVRAHRAAEAAGHALDVVAVSRFSDARTRTWLAERGIRTIACDLLAPNALSALPAAADVIYLVGMKFGTQQAPAQTWAVNTLAPAYVAERYPAARIVALSTGNVYPLVPVEGGGAGVDHPLTPLGEYANACVARERIFEYASRRQGTPVALVRLNYAIDLRYGVLLDIGRKVWQGAPVDVTMGYVNVIWQGDANDMILRALPLATSPPYAFNLTGEAVLSVRALAEGFAVRLGRGVRFVGREADTALLSDAAEACARLGAPPTSVETMLDWTAHWIRIGGATLEKPTHFEVRDGGY